MTWQSALKKTGLYLLKIIIVLILIAAAFIGGVMIGYGVIGDGNSPMDVFEPELWQHILEFIL
ncbi:DNA-directed RNA polymerase subunit beta [Marinilactibacillus sp. XAAS-LB27]|uniref:DNA-directed RNA polymerase subunit beta n=1 Tax=unclassified Marinilactibacillus TaxID=2632303 RepID=UPI001CE3F2EF|nr:MULTISPECIES: DNA-directed RNA polymerase subunit beta [unclassified Marinilactibacillus]MEC6748450.1 DNA-directed RNA polymerase subunit beta [Marinilactibacillus sp. XAAS-LB27]